MSRNQSGPLPIVLGSIGILCLTVMDGLIKSVAADTSVLMISVLRFSLGAAVSLVLYLASGAPRFTRATLIAAFWRGATIALSSLTFIGALGMLPLAEAIALSFLAPIVVAVLGRVFLKEAIAASTGIAILLGSAGVGVMVFDGLSAVEHTRTSLFGAALVMSSTFTYAASQLILRARTAHDPLASLVLLQSAIPALYIAPFAAMNWQLPPVSKAWLFICLALLGTAGHYFLALAYKRADASRVATVEYTAFIWAAIIGYVWFSEIPSLSTCIGTGLILCGAIAVARHRGERTIPAGDAAARQP